MSQQHISRFYEGSYVLVEPMSYEDKIRKILATIYLSRFDINYLSRIEKLEDDVSGIKEEMKELKKEIIYHPLHFLSQKLRSQGRYAVLREKDYDVLFITNSRKEAVKYSFQHESTFIFRLR